VFVETFEIFTYICAGRQLSNNLFPHLPERQPLAHILKKNHDKEKPEQKGSHQDNSRQNSSQYTKTRNSE
jgi:hypothetical protein